MQFVLTLAMMTILIKTLSHLLITGASLKVQFAVAKTHLVGVKKTHSRESSATVVTSEFCIQ